MKKATSTVAERAGEQTRLVLFAVQGFGCPRINFEACTESEAKRSYKEMFSISPLRDDSDVQVEQL